MKFKIPYLQLGETVTGQVVENLPGRELLINFNGDLVRVSNETNKSFTKDDTIELIVTALQPLQFRFPQHAHARKARSAKIDVSV